jgi:hypothetical protein
LANKVLYGRPPWLARNPIHKNESPNPHLNNKITGQNARYLRAIQPQKEKKRNNAKPLPTPASNKTHTK